MKKNIKKTIYSLIILLSVFSINKYSVYATSTGRVSSTTGIVVRKGAGTTYTKVTTVPYNKTVTINSTNTKTSDSSTACSTGIWYNITYSGYTGYACSRYIEITTTNTSTTIPQSDISKMTDAEFETYLINQGFPESYRTKLKALHKTHPNWVFVGIKSRDNWSTTLKNEMVSGRSLYQSKTNATQGYLSTADGDYNWYTNKFIAHDGSTWFQANSATISYYMDPRNWLSEKSIFMFEDLNYYSTYQTEETVKTILYTDFYKNLTKYYMTAASKYNVSPIYLAALTKQEVGLTSGYATSGTTSTYCGTDYTGYYNFYNIGATAGTKPVCNGLSYAKTKGWTSPEKSIVGGASWIVSGYIDIYQNTPYFQKWNTSSKSKNKYYYHQYMANIAAVASSASSTYNSYSSMGILEYPIVFQIPIYDGIPNSTSLPATGNPNNYLSTLKINGTSVTNFDGANTNYTVTINKTGNTKIEATPVASTSTISGTGTFEITSSGTKKTVSVKSQNGNTKTYAITFNIVETKQEETNTQQITTQSGRISSTTGVIMRKGAGSSYDQITSIPYNSTITINSTNTQTNDSSTGCSTGIWYNVTYSEKTGYVCSRYIEIKTEETNSEQTINYPTVSETISGANYKVKSNYLYNLTLGSTISSTIEKLQKANSYASINITNSNNVAKTSGSIVTGDKITITSNKETITYTAVIYGDVNGDGLITIVDLAKIQKNLLKVSTLSGAYAEAADTNKNGKIDIVDLAQVQKQLLKVSNISQS